MTDTNNTDGAALLPVTADDVTKFLNFAFRHIRLPLLDAGDIDDIRAGLEHFCLSHRIATQKDAVRALSDLQRLGQEYDGEAVREAVKRAVVILQQGRDGMAAYRQARIIAALAALNPAQATPSALSGEPVQKLHELPRDVGARAVELLREYMDAEEIDDVDARASELGACRFSVRSFLAALPSHKGAGE